MKTVPHVTAQQAPAAANLFLSDHLPDRFTASQAQITANGDVWQVPVILSYPFIGSLGNVGEVLVSTASEIVVSHTSFKDMKQAGQKLYEARQDEISANFS
jgi:hypothetical protein